jgi:hypothetical protein
MTGIEAYCGKYPKAFAIKQACDATVALKPVTSPVFYRISQNNVTPMLNTAKPCQVTTNRFLI